MLLFNLHGILLCNICTLFFAIATIKCHGQINLQKEEFTFQRASQGTESITVGKSMTTGCRNRKLATCLFICKLEIEGIGSRDRLKPQNLFPVMFIHSLARRYLLKCANNWGPTVQIHELMWTAESVPC